MKRRMKIFAYLVLILTTKSFISGTNYYVAVSYGDDTNNGLSISVPFLKVYLLSINFVLYETYNKIMYNDFIFI